MCDDGLNTFVKSFSLSTSSSLLTRMLVQLGPQAAQRSVLRHWPEAFLRGAAEAVFVSGTFWFAPAPMAAALATLRVLEKTDAIAHGPVGRAAGERV